MMTAAAIPHVGLDPFDLVGVPYAPLGRDPARGLDCWGVVVLCKPAAPDYAFDTSARLSFARSVATVLRDPRWVEFDAPVDRCLVMLDRTHSGVWWKGSVVHATRVDGVRADPAGDLSLLGYPEPRFGEWIG